MLFQFFLFLQLCRINIGANSNFNAQAWQSLGIGEYTFPENDVPYVASRPNVGVTFSGGGDRSFTATIGALGAFHELGFMENIKYLVGSSGGSWGVTVYTYYQYDFVNDSVMLGPIVFPSDITYDNLNDCDINCVRRFPSSNYIDNSALFSGWVDAVQAIYLNTSGISTNVPFSYNNDTVSDIKKRNPSLADTEFYIQRGNNDKKIPGIDTRPVLIVQATMDGPFNHMPWDPSNRNYSQLEWTPFTAGITYTKNIVYNGKEENSSYHSIQTIGGYVEPFASAGEAGPKIGLPNNVNTGFLTIPYNYNGFGDKIYCDLAQVAGTSSYAPGQDIAASKDKIIERSAGDINYWSPSADDPESGYIKMAVGDGCGVSNTDLVSLLVRNVTQLIVFVNTDTPLQNASHWIPGVGNITTQIDFTVPAWFGIIYDNISYVNDAGYDLKNSHVFEEDEFVTLAVKLQAAQTRGYGVVANMTHTTVQNDQYGVVGGRKVNILWFYLASRVTQWENQLNEEMQSYLIPKDDPDNQAVFPKDGPFRDFPGYGTTLASENIKQANLLADLVGWIVYQNADLFREYMLITSFRTVNPTFAPTTSIISNSSDDFFTTREGYFVIIIGIIIITVGIVITTYFLFCKKSTINNPLLKEPFRSSDIESSFRKSEIESSFRSSDIEFKNSINEDHEI